MRHCLKAVLGPIVQGLMAASLCTLAAAAQQSAAPPASSLEAAATHAPNAKTKDAAAAISGTPTDPEPAQTHDASSDDHNTGVANPDPVTPASEGQNSTQPAADTTPAPTYVDNSNPIPAAEAGDGSLLQEGATGKRFAPDQPSQPITSELDSDKPAPRDPAPTAPAVTVVPPQQSAPAPAPASSEITPARLGSATPPPQSPAAPDSSTVQPSVSAPVADVPQQTAPATSPAPKDSSTAPQQSAPATSESAAPAAQTPAAPDPSAAAPPSAPAPDASASPQTTPTAPPADSSAPQQSVPAAPQAPPPASPDSTPAPGTPPAGDTNAPAPEAAAPASASQDQSPAAPQAPAPADNTAVNPSLPEPQVNEPEPPPASRFDIFGGYIYLRPSGDVGTWSFPTNNTRGYSASGTYFFNRRLGVQAEFSHSEYPLGTTGTSPAPPFVQLGGVTDSFYTVEGGPVYRYFLGEHIVPFIHLTAGGAKIAGPKFQPPTWGYGFNYGGGIDVLLPHSHEHVALRVAQLDFGYMHADQGALQQYDLAGGTQAVSALRLSAGLVFRLGEMNPKQSKSLACDASPSEVYAGERVTLAATLRNYRDKTKNPFFFRWELSAGKQQGFGPVIFVDTTGLGEGTYHATAHISAKEKGKQFAQCSTDFVVKASPAPTLKCSADPSTVTPGEVSIITAYAASIAQRQLTYSYTTSEGQIDGKNSTAQLHTDGLPPGIATVTCHVVDDLGQTAVATTEVTIAPPSLPPAPKAQPLCTVYFNRDMRRPARVDNEGRACLDDIALTMEHQPDARLVLVGEHSDSEVDGQLTAAERAMNTRAYLANEKGIDPARVDVRTSTTSGRQVQTFLLAPGAIFDQPTEGRIDESKIKIHGQQYARQHVRAPQKGPVGQGVSHPPKN